MIPRLDMTQNDYSFLFRKQDTHLCLEETHDLWLLLSQSSLNRSAMRRFGRPTTRWPADPPPASWQHHGDRLENWLQPLNAWCRRLANLIPRSELQINKINTTNIQSQSFMNFWTHLEKPCQAHFSSFSHPGHLCPACWAWHTFLVGYCSLQL